jgi:hypothetical protein
MYTGENRPMTTQEISNRNSDAAVGTLFRISNSFKEASRNLIIFFFFKRQPEYLNAICAYTESTDLI